MCVCVLSLLWRLRYTHISSLLKGLDWVWLPWECLEALTPVKKHTHTHVDTHTDFIQALFMVRHLFPGFCEKAIVGFPRGQRSARASLLVGDAGS